MAARTPTTGGTGSRSRSARGTKTAVDVDGHRIELSNLEKVLYPDDGFTKAQVLEYCAGIAPVLVPHLRGRPLTLKRYPDGIDGESFYEKQCPRHRPEWMPTADVPSGRNGSITYCTVEDAASLVWVANLGTLELHPLLARATAIEEPTMLVLDLDPGPPAGVLDAARLAIEVRALLVAAGLEPYVKTSGGKGIHVAAPLPAGVTYDQTKPAAQAIALELEQRMPDGVVSSMRKELRAGKVLVDWSQNDRHKSTVVAYSLRAHPGPTVSTPITWDELQRAVATEDASRLRFGPDDVLARVARDGDLHAALA